MLQPWQYQQASHLLNRTSSSHTWHFAKRIPLIIFALRRQQSHQSQHPVHLRIRMSKLWYPLFLVSQVKGYVNNVAKYGRELRKSARKADQISRHSTRNAFYAAITVYIMMMNVSMKQLFYLFKTMTHMIKFINCGSFVIGR